LQIVADCHCWPEPFLHLKRMRIRIALFVVSGLIVSAVGCFSNQKESPEQIRQKTAQATSELKQDTKAVAEGIRDGLRRDKLVDLNHASKAQLATLPGVDPTLADRIIEERPYRDPGQLVSRRILSREQYDQLRDRVTVTP
jgi:Helix-hairpin-helix motif